MRVLLLVAVILSLLAAPAFAQPLDCRKYARQLAECTACHVDFEYTVLGEVTVGLLTHEHELYCEYPSE